MGSTGLLDTIKGWSVKTSEEDPFIEMLLAGHDLVEMATDDEPHNGSMRCCHVAAANLHQ